MIRISRRYNLKFDRPDHRDVRYLTIPTVPQKVDLRPLCSPVFDQGTIGSCTANALAGAIEFLELKENRTPGQGPEEFADGTFLNASRLFIYWNERILEGSEFHDSGAMLRDGIKTLNQIGVCEETIWPYAVDLLFKRPDYACFTEAGSHKISLYASIQNLFEMKSCLAEGYPFVFGFTVFDNFEDDEIKNTGILKMPDSDQAALGGHAVMAVGYDDERKVFIVRNSWGSSWGDKGYFYMPYDYIEALADDFWTIRL